MQDQVYQRGARVSLVAALICLAAGDVHVKGFGALAFTADVIAVSPRIPGEPPDRAAPGAGRLLDPRPAPVSERRSRFRLPAGSAATDSPGRSSPRSWLLAEPTPEACRKAMGDIGAFAGKSTQPAQPKQDRVTFRAICVTRRERGP
jgi:hypothetical protein